MPGERINERIVKAKCLKQCFDNALGLLYYPGFEYELDLDSDAAKLVGYFDYPGAPKEDVPRCESCQRNFKSQFALEKHMRIHQNALKQQVEKQAENPAT